MKRFFSLLIALALLAFVASPALAAFVPPSTNDINRTNGWAHVNEISSTTDSITLEFVSTRGFLSCFEYRVDGESSQYGNIYPHPIVIGDFYYYYKCIANETYTKTFDANEYVEIRMTFGAEGDERFDWTRFDVLFNRTAEITSPSANEVVSGNISFEATLNDKDKDDIVQWAVRKGTCASGVANVIGNVDGHSDSFTWDGTNFHATADTTSWEDGEYCFVFNPSESAGDIAIRETREFTVNNTPDNKEQCKNDGWKTFFTPTFKNQGDCVSSIQSSPKAIGNKK